MDRNFINALPGAVYWLDSKNRYQGCNLAQAKLFGLAAPEDIIGMKTADLPVFKGKPEMAAQLDNEHLKLMRQEKQNIAECKMHTDGQDKIYLTTKSQIVNAQNEVTGLIVMSFDVSQAQHALISQLKENIQAKHTLDTLLTSLPGHIYWKDLQGCFLGCNLLQAQSAGYSSREEMIGKSDYEMPWKAQADLYKKNDQYVMATGHAIHEEEEITLNTGELRTFLSNKVPYRDENGNITGVLGISVDISDQKRIEIALKETSLALESILANLPGHVYWKNLAGRYLGCNVLAAKCCGFNSPHEMIGKTDYELPWPKEQAALYQKNDNQVMLTGIPILIEEEGILESGKIHTFLSNKIPLRDNDNKIIGMLGISLDITTQKKMQEVLQTDLKKAEGQIEGMTLISAAMAHELRTPLATITMGMQGIEKYLHSLIAAYQIAQEHQLPVDPIPKRLLANLSIAVKNVKGEAKNANMIINMLLANLSQQKGKALKTPLSIAQCINTALNQYSFARGKRQLVHLDVSQDFIFYGDLTLFLQILFNLFKNAFYFIDKVGKGEIYIALVRGEDFNVLHFKDTGQGIDTKHLPLIFEQFFTKNTHHGTGIGLAFCKVIMESWGGSITCHSEYDKYTEFVLKFPCNYSST